MPRSRRPTPNWSRRTARGIPVMLRPVVLAKLMAGHTTLMVTGTHGKTTTTSMLIVALQHCGFDPSFAVGGELGEAGTNAHHGSGDCFVAEADESDGSLLEYTPERRGGDQHRGRPSGLLRQRRGLHARCSTSSSSGWRPAAHWWCAPTTPGAAALGRTHRGAGDPGAALRQRRTERTTLAATLLSWEQQGTGAVAHIQLAGESHPRVMRLSVPGRHMALNALAALLAAVEVGAPSRRCSTGWPVSKGCGAASSWSAPPTACGCSTTTPITRPRSVPRSTALRTVTEQSGGGRSIVVFSPTCIRGQQAFAQRVRAGAGRRRRGVRARRLRGA